MIYVIDFTGYLYSRWKVIGAEPSVRQQPSLEVPNMGIPSRVLLRLSRINPGSAVHGFSPNQLPLLDV